MNCLVAYDEEWESTAFWKYAHPAIDFARIILYEVSDRFLSKFRIKFRVGAVRTWDSYDYPATDDEMLNESRDETGFRTGMTIDGIPIHVLVAFTDQRIPSVGYTWGYSDYGEGIVLVGEYTTYWKGQHTDNVLQHELTHLYGITEEDEHEVDGLDCVMNGWDIWLPFPDHHWIPYCLTTNNWCSECKETIWAHRANWGYYSPSGGGEGGAGDRVLYPYGDEYVEEDENI